MGPLRGAASCWRCWAWWRRWTCGRRRGCPRRVVSAASVAGRAGPSLLTLGVRNDAGDAVAASWALPSWLLRLGKPAGRCRRPCAALLMLPLLPGTGFRAFATRRTADRTSWRRCPPTRCCGCWPLAPPWPPPCPLPPPHPSAGCPPQSCRVASPPPASSPSRCWCGPGSRPRQRLLCRTLHLGRGVAHWEGDGALLRVTRLPSPTNPPAPPPPKTPARRPTPPCGRSA